MATYTMKLPYGEYPAQYLPSHWAVDYNPSMDELLDYGIYTKSTTTKAVYQMDNGVDLVITGSSLSYNSGSGILNGGTISAVTLVDHAGGAVMQTVTGLKWSGANFYDTVRAGSSWYTAEVILSGNDTVKGSTGHDELWGHSGNDTLIGGDGVDNLAGGRGADTYDGGNGLDQMSFDDAYWDASGASGVTVDMVKGTATDPWGSHDTFKNIERIKGTQFSDKMYGSSGDDEFRPLGGKDYVDGRGGKDTIRYDRDAQHDGKSGVTVDLKAGTATDGFGDKDTLKNIENVKGSNRGDKITGSDGANTLDGSAGNDKLYGGLGKDLLIGGDGKDTFVFSTKLSSTNIDTIDDFKIKADVIWLDNDVFTKAGAVGDLASGAFYTGSKAHDSSDRIVYDKASGKLWYDDDGSGSHAAVQVALLDKGLALAATHFDIIG